jgi:hypothetical protein
MNDDVYHMYMNGVHNSCKYWKGCVNLVVLSLSYFHVVNFLSSHDNYFFVYWIYDAINAYVKIVTMFTRKDFREFIIIKNL